MKTKSYIYIGIISFMYTFLIGCENNKIVPDEGIEQGLPLYVYDSESSDCLNKSTSESSPSQEKKYEQIRIATYNQNEVRFTHYNTLSLNPQANSLVYSGTFL